MRGGRARCTSEPPPRDPTDLIVASLSAGSYPHAPWGNVQTGAPLPILDGKYQLLRQLGEGGMGAVYEARHKATGRHVAVKVIVGEALAKNAEVVRRFEREAMATGKIQSQYIAHTLDAGVDPATGSPYLVMDLFQGEDLQHAIGRLGPLQPDVALRIAAQVCLGLQKAHEADVIHRDIKPANIFLARHEESEIVVKILDFGIAKVKLDGAEAPGPAMTRTGSMLGSPLYMSPEQARGRKTVDQRSDIWSVGVVLYEALTGTTPHAQAETIGEIIIQICATPPRPVQELAPWVPQAVADIVHKALALESCGSFRVRAGDVRGDPAAPPFRVHPRPVDVRAFDSRGAEHSGSAHLDPGRSPRAHAPRLPIAVGAERRPGCVRRLASQHRGRILSDRGGRIRADSLTADLDFDRGRRGRGRRARWDSDDARRRPGIRSRAHVGRPGAPRRGLVAPPDAAGHRIRHRGHRRCGARQRGPSRAHLTSSAPAHEHVPCPGDAHLPCRVLLRWGREQAVQAGMPVSSLDA